MLGALVVPAEVFAVCTSAEVCGNGADEDCDGAVDEGCALLNTLVTVPYKFGTQGFQAGSRQYGAELKADPIEMLQFGANGSTLADYSPMLDYRWLIGMSSHAASCRVNFSWFDLENGFDYLTLGPWSGTGTKVAWPPVPGSGTTSGFFAPSGVNLPTARLVTDGNNSAAQNATLGFRTVSQDCLYVAGPVQPPYWTLPLNTAVDGTLLVQKDDAFYTFVLPAGREALISIDHMGDAPQNFDLAATSDGSMPSISACGNPGTSCSTAARGEFLRISSAWAARTFKLRVHASAGVGRYRLFVASPNAGYPCSGTANAVDVGIESETSYDWEQARVNAALTTMAVDILAATDGQYLMSSGFYILNGIPANVPFAAFEVVLDNDDDCGLSCDTCTPGVHIDLGLTHWIEIPRWVWRGEAWGSCGTYNTTMVGEVLAHEWGHYAWHLDDQYDDNGRIGCSHSMMSGPIDLAYRNERIRSLEFCTSANHLTSFQNGASWMGDTVPDWERIVGTCPSTAPPNFFGQSTTADFTQLSHMANGGMSFGMTWYFYW